MSETVFIGLGSNLGNRENQLSLARNALSEIAEQNQIEASDIFESEAHVPEGRDQDPPFLNQVIRFQTDLDPWRLMEKCLAIEKDQGRIRSEIDRWVPRVIDLDILVYGHRTVYTDYLQIPHPRLTQRRFVLEPLSELDPDLIIPFPVLRNVRKLLDECPDFLTINRFLTQT